MINITYLNNKFVKHSNAKISIEDRGFLFADSIYELISVFNKKIIDTDQHLNRLRSSLNKVKIKFNYSIITESKKNVIRGMHYNKKMNEDKLVYILNGKIFDVTINLNKGKNYGKYFILT